MINEKQKNINIDIYYSSFQLRAKNTLNLIDKKISMERLEKIQSQLYDNQMHMNKSLEHKTINVLVENLTEDKTGVFGRSEYMTSVIFDGKKEDIGKIVPVKINKSNRSTLFGEKDFNSNQKVA